MSTPKSLFVQTVVGETRSEGEGPRPELHGIGQALQGSLCDAIEPGGRFAGFVGGSRGQAEPEVEMDAMNFVGKDPIEAVQDHVPEAPDRNAVALVRGDNNLIQGSLIEGKRHKERHALRGFPGQFDHVGIRAERERNTASGIVVRDLAWLDLGPALLKTLLVPNLQPIGQLDLTAVVYGLAEHANGRMGIFRDQGLPGYGLTREYTRQNANPQPTSLRDPNSTHVSEPLVVLLAPSKPEPGKKPGPRSDSLLSPENPGPEHPGQKCPGPENLDEPRAHDHATGSSIGFHDLPAWRPPACNGHRQVMGLGGAESQMMPTALDGMFR